MPKEKKKTIYKVVINCEEQYSIRLTNRGNTLGWGKELTVVWVHFPRLSPLAVLSRAA
jgi:hypothetical protein